MLAPPKELSLMCLQDFHIKTSNGLEIVACLSRGDVNMPEFDRMPIHEQAKEAAFEVAVYNLLRLERNIWASCLLYHHIPILHPGPKLSIPQDLASCRLFMFEKAEGVNNIWDKLSAASKI